jgi:hypothetical protein
VNGGSQSPASQFLRLFLCSDGILTVHAVRDDVSSWVSCLAGSTKSSSSNAATAAGQQLPFRASDDNDGPPECALDWAVPVHDLNCEYVFPSDYNPKAPLVELDTPDYYGRVRKDKVFEMLLAQAGLRLAALLNMILADPAEIEANGYLKDWTIEAEEYRQTFAYRWFGLVW